MWFVKNPEWFDVIVTDNMFGDIITDLGAMIQGGLGLAAGGNINPEGISMFEPMGGSAPKYTGKNVINPMAAIGSVKVTAQFQIERYSQVMHIGSEVQGRLRDGLDALDRNEELVATTRELVGWGAGMTGP